MRDVCSLPPLPHSKSPYRGTTSGPDSFARWPILTRTETTQRSWPLSAWVSRRTRRTPHFRDQLTPASISVDADVTSGKDGLRERSISISFFFPLHIRTNLPYSQLAGLSPVFLRASGLSSSGSEAVTLSETRCLNLSFTIVRVTPV